MTKTRSLPNVINVLLGITDIKGVTHLTFFFNQNKCKYYQETCRVLNELQVEQILEGWEGCLEKPLFVLSLERLGSGLY